MIYVFTDFGYSGPYVGELHAVLTRQLTDVPVIDLLHDAPMFNPRASSYLLAAVSRQFQHEDVCLAVVDPGVGLEQRRVLLIEADGITYCGPDNGLLSQVVRLAQQVSCYEILWRPTALSDSFHARDVFAPAIITHMTAASLLVKQAIGMDSLVGIDWETDIYSVIYFDQFGNGVTGIRARTVKQNWILEINKTQISYARTFAEVAVGHLFWYINSMGLVELAVNQGSAREKLALSIGTTLSVVV